MDPAPVDRVKYKRLRRIEAPRHSRALNFSCFHSRPFLKSDRACRWLQDAVARALPAHGCDLWAYCFMPSHAHLLVYPRGDHPSMEDFLESLKKSSTKRALAWVRANAPGFLPRMRDQQPNGKVSGSAAAGWGAIARCGRRGRSGT
jgi:REP element-mobilizing transposase RayT